MHYSSLDSVFYCLYIVAQVLHQYRYFSVWSLIPNQVRSQNGFLSDGKKLFPVSRNVAVDHPWTSEVPLFRHLTENTTHAHRARVRRADGWGAQDGWYVMAEMDSWLPMRRSWCVISGHHGEIKMRQTGKAGRLHLKTRQRELIDATYFWSVASQVFCPYMDLHCWSPFTEL